MWSYLPCHPPPTEAATSTALAEQHTRAQLVGPELGPDPKAASAVGWSIMFDAALKEELVQLDFVLGLSAKT